MHILITTRNCSSNFAYLDWYGNKLGVRDYLAEKNKNGKARCPHFVS